MYMTGAPAVRPFIAFILCGLALISGCAATGEHGSGAADGAMPVEEKTADKAAAEASISIERISVTGNEDSVEIVTASYVRYTAFKLTDPPCLVLDIPGASI
ncbi:MAG: AMIN domain-containing protein [Deltaproteobacteria bacterium]